MRQKTRSPFIIFPIILVAFLFGTGCPVQGNVAASPAADAAPAAPAKYKLTLITDGHGTASPASETEVAADASISIGANPDTDYSFLRWTVVSGAAALADALNANTTVKLSGDATLMASFIVTAPSGNFLSCTDSSDSARSFKLVRIEGNSGAVTDLGGGGYTYFLSMDYAPDGTLYGIGNSLNKIDPATGAVTYIAPLCYTSGGSTSTVLMCDAAFSPTGTLYALENATARRLFTVDLSTGALALVGAVSGYVRGIAFANDGTLYGSMYDLFILDPADASTISTIGSTGSIIGGLCFDADGNLFGLYVLPANLTKAAVFALDKSSGRATKKLALDSTGPVTLVSEGVFPAPASPMGTGPTPVASRSASAVPSADSIERRREYERLVRSAKDAAERAHR